MIHLTLQERKVLLLLAFFLITGVAVSYYSKTHPQTQESHFGDAYARPQKPGLLDINLAEKQQLTVLPGVGDTTAEKIIRYRKEHGPFKSVDELKNIKGIGQKKLERIKERIVVNFNR